MRSFTFSVLLTLVLLSLGGCLCPPEPQGYCGDQRCDVGTGESQSTCALDCQGQSSTYCDVPADPNGAELNLWLMQQWCEQWCWAAVITNISNYYDRTIPGTPYPVSECNLASAKIGDQSLSICCQYGACQYQPCNQPASFQEMNIFLSQLGITGQLLPRPLSESEIQVEISNGRPIIMAMQSMSSGHVALITGYQPGAGPAGETLYRVDDPWPFNEYGVPASDGSGVRYLLAYNRLRFGATSGQAYWAASYTRLSPRQDGCSPPVNPSCSCEQH